MKKASLDSLAIGNGNSTLLALHASGTGAGSLSRLAKQLCGDLQVLIPNLHGYGSSKATLAPNDLALEQHLEIASFALSTLRDQAPEKPIHLFGHSMGGLIAAQLAIRFENLSSLTLAEPMIFGALDPNTDADAIATDRKSTSGLLVNDPTGLARFISFWNGTDWDQLPEGAKAAIAGLQGQIAHEALQVSTTRIDKEQLAEIKCPVQVIRGTQTNTVAARICQRLAEQFPEWTQTAIEGAGHMLPIEQPEEVARSILRIIG